ncbi:COP9 signalosome subunit 1 [Aspergillus tubingensis]|nr:COP9 signalosome subunit 1 [Aspergillus tubingensis]GFN20130.1 COP9 signalosome subunit 1 [Aspergillus tubingensis]
MPGDRGSRFCRFCSRPGHEDTQCNFLTLCRGLYELSLMVSHRPGTRVNLTETQRALDRIVTRRNRNRRRAIRRRERVRARITDVARRGNHALNISRRGPVHAAASMRSVPSTMLRLPAIPPAALTSGPANAQVIPGEEMTLPAHHLPSLPAPEAESVSPVPTATSDTDVTMGVEELEISTNALEASRSQSADDLIVLDTLDTADDFVVMNLSQTNEIIENHCAELFTIV